jgi:hypothetical protein
MQNLKKWKSFPFLGTILASNPEDTPDLSHIFIGTAVG